MTVYNMCWFLSKISSTRRLEEKNRQDEQTLLKREEEPKWEGGEVRRRKAAHKRIDSVVSDDGVVLPAQVILALAEEKGDGRRSRFREELNEGAAEESTFGEL